MDVRKARYLRSHPTEAEQKLWQHIRQRQMLGYKFRRQRPIGPYIVDFVCLEARLIIELDGGQHQWQYKYDEERTAWLESEGYHVHRFWNHDVLNNIDGVLQYIETILWESAS